MDNIAIKQERSVLPYDRSCGIACAILSCFPRGRRSEFDDETAGNRCRARDADILCRSCPMCTVYIKILRTKATGFLHNCACYRPRARATYNSRNADSAFLRFYDEFR